MGIEKNETSTINPSLREELESIVKECMKSFDGSHDFYHVERVRNLSLQIAVQENIKDLELVELVALLHDVNDHKYVQKENNKNNNDKIKGILNKYKISSEKQEKISLLIDNLSFSKENKIKHSENPEDYSKYLLFIESNPELGCVQDADRLDAIGAIGIARTFCYGGSKKNRLLFNYPVNGNGDDQDDDNKDIMQWIQNKKSDKTTIGHFYDKLLLLKDLMKTESGKKMAQKRHQTMQLFLNSFFDEWQGK